MPEPDALRADEHVVPVTQAAGFRNDQQAVRSCLLETTPRVPAWFGYDERGSMLFESITELPTYYLTRVERSLLRRHAAEIAGEIHGNSVVELGSGSAKKTRLLLSACLRRRPTHYVPIDVSRAMLETSINTLRQQHPGLAVQGLWGRYENALAWLREHAPGPAVFTLLGSNLGNATPAERHDLLADIAATTRAGDQFLVSADLHKSADVLETCYNDPPGRAAFAEFRLNHLTHLNRRFDADFDPASFSAKAHYDTPTTTVEGHLYTRRPAMVTLPGLALTLQLPAGGSMNVGYSKKFIRRTFVAELAEHGFTPQAEWTDPTWNYGIFLLRRR